MRIATFQINPYVNESGTIVLPDNIDADDDASIEDYIYEHFDDAVLEEHDRSYDGADVEFIEVEEVDEYTPDISFPATTVTADDIERAKKFLIDAGVAPDKAPNVLRDISSTLFHTSFSL